MTDVLIAYVTCATLEEARAIGRVLVEENLAACVNLRPHHAIYRWGDRIEEAEEIALFAKTSRAAWETLQARVKALHSYDLPCIVALPVEGGLPAYLDWIHASLQG